jgi:hypothetical protein
VARTLADRALRSGFPVTLCVFVSRPALLSRGQDARLRQWLRRLESLGLDPFTLDRDSYDMPPWDQMRTAIGGADGLLILGFRQLHVREGVWRPGTIESRTAADWWGTPWNHIEAGFGLMARVPVLVAHEAGVTEGIFCRDAWGGDLFGVRLEAADAVDLSSDDTSGAVVTAWAQAVREANAFDVSA